MGVLGLPSPNAWGEGLRERGKEREKERAEPTWASSAVWDPCSQGLGRKMWLVCSFWRENMSIKNFPGAVKLGPVLVLNTHLHKKYLWR